MNTRRQFVVLALVSGLMLSPACKKKKPQLPTQAQAPVPTITTPLPDTISEAAPPPPPPSPPKEPAATPPSKPKSQPHHRRKPSQPNQNASSNATGNNSAVAAAHPPPNPATGASSDIAINAEVSDARVTQQQQTTAQLLDAAEKNLKTLPATLGKDEDAMVAQVKTYISQSHAATADKDFERAYNLALKARLLSDALLKK
jgi:hypothetical protein